MTELPFRARSDVHDRSVRARLAGLALTARSAERAELQPKRPGTVPGTARGGGAHGGGNMMAWWAAKAPPGVVHGALGMCFDARSE